MSFANSSLILFVFLLRTLYISHCSGIYRDAYIHFFVLKTSSWRLFSLPPVEASINIGERHVVLGLFVLVDNDHLAKFADGLGLVLRFEVVVETDLALAVVRSVFIVVVAGLVLALAEGVEFGVDVLLGGVGEDAGDVGFAALGVVALLVDDHCQWVPFFYEIEGFAHAVII